MTNEQKAQRLDDIATHYIQIGQKDAALLRECAAMMREREAVQWHRNRWPDDYLALHKERLISVRRIKVCWEWRATWGGFGAVDGVEDSLQAAQAAAVAWVEGQEGGKRQTVEWDAEGGATKDGRHRWAGPVLNGFISLVTKDGRTLHCDWHPTLEAARAAVVAWVDEQEARGVK